ncbi:MAG TPA: THUMP domain-containing protein [Pyrinomonadaceae bacterium]|nr:THUMP domain-containing protein [Pyrinomonadaceae bacterium]
MRVAEVQKPSKLVVTSRAPFTARKTRAALRRAVFPGRITRTGFRSVFVVEAEGEPLELARKVYEECGQLIGRATAVLAEVESQPEPVKEAAVEIGTERIGPKESFCFRLFKRGVHSLQEDTPKIEYEIGGAINAALELKTGQKPLVSLSDPVITINAEVLGPITFVGVFRKEWQIAAPGEELTSKELQAKATDLQSKEATVRLAPSLESEKPALFNPAGE